MSEAETLVQAYIDAFNNQDPEALFATLAEDVVHDINEGGSETGKDAFRRFKAHMDECYREHLADVVIMANGNRCAAEFVVEGTYIKTDGSLPEATGQTYSIRAAAFYEVSGGKITRVTSYYNLNGWLQAIKG